MHRPQRHACITLAWRVLVALYGFFVDTVNIDRLVTTIGVHRIKHDTLTVRQGCYQMLGVRLSYARLHTTRTSTCITHALDAHRSRVHLRQRRLEQ
jgi:hypothetical protein